ncbi:hypothetical protein [Micromonospora zhanjiangensis]|uniref:Replication region DNA-binding N-term n=1 Tax=Micromonospora zhanjiangensis TaxID=1522057 RepID=A0ABV8KSX6_9ACTN
MRGVADALRELIESWHGRKYASVATLAAEIKKQTGQDVRNRLYRELHGRPSWQCVEWIVEYCAPVDAPHEWRRQRFEELAGRWSVERAEMPPGYAGRVVLDGEELRPPVLSSMDADDLLTQVRLLKREREDAEKAIAQQETQVQLLRDEVASLRAEAEQISQESVNQLRRFSDNADTLLEQLRLVQGQLDDSARASANLVQENQRYQEQAEALRRERDQAREEADRRYRALAELRTSEEAARYRLNRTIDELENRVSGLRRELDRARRGVRDEAQAPTVSDDDAPPPLSRSPLSLGRDGVLGRKRR